MAGASPFGLPEADLRAVAEEATADLVALSGTRLLVTGGTGFLGRWLVATLLLAGVPGPTGELVVLSRRPDAVPLEDGPGLRLLGGDVAHLARREGLGGFDLVVHAAASSSAGHGTGDGEARTMAATIFDGTRAALEVAARRRSRVLFLSSGAVYGPRTAPVAEDDPGAPDPLDPRAAYAEAKRLAENLCASATAAGDVEAVVARCFAFVGPGIPLRAHYAAGNFLADALEARPIAIDGDGRPLRSYLYCADLARWCVALLVRGIPGRAYNVGSPTAVSIRELADRCVTASGRALPVEVGSAPGPGPAPCYVPVVARAKEELGLQVRVGLDQALARTLGWLRAGHAR